MLAKQKSDFDKNNLIFFCGSGISYDSALPSAKEILEQTSQIFLPENIDKTELSYIIKKIQPEIFYEHLLKLTGSKQCLVYGNACMAITIVLCQPRNIYLL